MIKYQYQTILIPMCDLDNKLNTMGNKGWRVISINKLVNTQFQCSYECVFEKIIM